MELLHEKGYGVPSHSNASFGYVAATSFRGERPGAQDLVMQADNAVRTAILKTLPGAYQNPHVYRRGADAGSQPS